MQISSIFAASTTKMNFAFNCNELLLLALFVCFLTVVPIMHYYFINTKHFGCTINTVRSSVIIPLYSIEAKTLPQFDVCVYNYNI